MPSWKKVVLHGSSGSLAHLKLENLTGQNVLGTDAQGNVVAGSVSGYSLPTATSTILGGIKVGNTLSISSGTLNAKTYEGASGAAIGGSEGSDGIAGYVPAATSGQALQFLRGDGTWQTPTNTVTRLRQSGGTLVAGDFTFAGSGATTVSFSNGVFTISSTDTNTTYSVGDGGLTEKNFTTALKSKLDGIAASADNYGGWTISDSTRSETIGSGNTLTVRGSGATAVSYDTSTNTLTISSTDTDTNTTYSAGTGLTLSGTTFSVTSGTYAAASHTHAISAVTDLQTALDGKAASSHTHAISDVTDLQRTLDGKAASSHTHSISNVTGLQSALDGKQAAGSYAASSHTHAISDVTNLQTALDGKAASSHNHDGRYYFQHTAPGSVLTPANGANDATAGWTALDGYGRAVPNYPSSHNQWWVGTWVGGNSERGIQLAGGYADSELYMRKGAAGWGSWIKIWNSSNLTNVSQLTNDAGYVTTDTNTTYSAGTGLTLSGTTFSVTAGTYAAASHTHAISDVTGLQTALDGKAASSHTHDDRYYTETESDARFVLNDFAAQTAITAEDEKSGTWNESPNDPAWGDYKPGNDSTAGYSWNDAPGYLQFNIPSGYTTAYIGQLRWDTGGYFDVHAVMSDGSLVLRGRFLSKNTIENTSHSGNHDGQQIIKVSGLDGMRALRITNQSGRIHLQGIGWSKEVDTAGTQVSETHWDLIYDKPSSFTPSSHTHSISNVTGLQSALDGKQAAGSYAASSHTHAISDVTDLQRALDGKAASSHTHAISDVTNLQTTLDGKAASSHTHSISNVTGLQTALDGKLGTSGKAADSETVDGIDSSRIIYGDGARGSTSTSNMNDPNQKSGFHFYYNPTGRPYEEWWNWITIAGNSWQSSNNYQFQLAHDFHNDRFYVRRMTNGSAADWREVITSGNIAAQSVSSATTATNLGTNFTADSWFRATSDNKQVRFYGNNRTMIFRTDGNTNDHGGGAYAYIWYYGGSADNTRRMILDTGGDLWTNSYGWLHDYFQRAGSYAASSHTHAISDVTDLQRALDGKAASSHTHAISDVTNLQTALDGKAASSHNHDDRYYTETESDARYLRGTTNPGTVNNFTISIGNNGSYSYVQSHSSQPLYLNPSGNAIVLNSGTTVAGQLNATGVSSGVSLNVGNASTHGVYTIDDARKQLVVSADYYPHIALVATGANNTNHGAVFSFVGSEGSSARQWNMGIPNSNPYIFSIGYNATGDNNPHYGVGDAWSGDDRHHARLSIDRSGNTKIRGMLYVNGTSGGITTGNAVLHTGNYSSYALPLSGGTVTGIAYFQTNNGGKSGATDSAKLQAYSTSNNSAFMSFHKAGHYAVNMGLDDDNVLRIGGWSASANRMQLDMSGNVTFAGNVTGYSDARIKTDIQTIGNALEKVKQLRGVTFKRTDSDDTSTNMGVIAQEVLAVVPEVISQDASGMYNVAYGNMAGLLIEAIKDQQALIDQQQKQIDELKALIHGLTK